ncbi:hypothetical protein FB45DRAFT_365165 [Roridomyces roridus]|uniref:Uncharacterized protein n=1 Tax=Roridomyces roridus TaxID=1738132 RepID=A0AAD7C8X1_9AGAR|nr:hypothetical protein FB45DRAFT_365165 [Roridomyces roridus]
MSRPTNGSQSIHIHGGTGGGGGEGGSRGGTGGRGDGPKVTFNNFKFHVRIQPEQTGPGGGDSNDHGLLDNIVTVKLGELRLEKPVDERAIVHRYPVYHKKTGAVKRYIEKTVGTRSIQPAHIFGHTDPMTAVVYRSRNDIGFIFAQRSREILEAQEYRLHLLTQLYGITRTPSLSAWIYHCGTWYLRNLQAQC